MISQRRPVLPTRSKYNVVAILSSMATTLDLVHDYAYAKLSNDSLQGIEAQNAVYNLVSTCLIARERSVSGANMKSCQADPCFDLVSKVDQRISFSG